MSEILIETPIPQIAPPSEDCFYGVAGDFVRLISPQTEASHVGLLGNFLVMSACIFGRHAYCFADGRTHYPSEFLVLVGDTGRSKKGTSTAHARRVADSVEQNFAANHIKSGASTGEGIIKCLQDAKPMGIDNFLWMLAEFDILLTCARREGNTISAILRQAWDGDALQIPTKTNPLSVSDYSLSIIGHATPEGLLNGFASVDLVNGFSNRFIFIQVERSQFLPSGGKPVNAELIVARLRAAQQAAQHVGLVQRNQEAEEFWDPVYRRLEDQPKGLKGALCSRASSHVLRLSLTFALLDGAKEISVRHIQAALAFWEYSERSVADIFSSRLGDPDADKIINAMKTGPQNMTDLHLVFHRNRTAEWLTAKVAAMEKAGLIFQTQKMSDRKTVIAWAKKR